MENDPDGSAKGFTSSETGRAEPSIEKLLTYRVTAEALGCPYFKIQRAARAGLFPTYRVFNGRRLLKLSEVIAVIDRSREGGEP